MNTRIWYHGTAASKVCLQAPPPFDMIPIPRPPLGSLGSPILFSSWTPFLPFSSISEPDPRLLVYTEKSSKCYKTWFRFLSPA